MPEGPRIGDDPESGDPQRPGELVAAGRALLVRPWRTAEADRSLFVLIRRHADVLDRWFTQRLGYRLVVTADTARLVKSGYVPPDRPLRTHTDHPFTARQYVMLALVLAATAAGPDRISLRDLVLQVRSAAADADISLDGAAGERRALVTALRFLIGHGVVRELDRSIGGYESDEGVDALLEIRNDRLAMLPAPALVGARSATDLLERAAGEGRGRAALRRRLVEDPVLHAEDVVPEDWAQLRRRFGEEARYCEEMFGLLVEARAEGVAAIDVDGGCSDTPFPATGTTAHAALLLVEALAARHRDGATVEQVDAELADLLERYGRYWRKDATADPARLRDDAVALLASMSLVRWQPDGRLCPRPAAARFATSVTVNEPRREQPAGEPEQPTLL
ncbi:TIGR02678 family protein [Frankia sp. QA3]|uniref:TIGR02678 family protein n=1 Tax=Frankia sp. QA3 TaxID=710111 RepID=UPI000269CA43|nr:TIGR02678 family protein [Frankia sp. QA3]EIV94702.1 TIGR02678 family protein [Frankia sp. QA3]